MEKGDSPQLSMETDVRLMNSQFGSNTLLGGIALDKDGNVGIARNTELFPHAYMAEGLGTPQIGFGRVLR
jgi:isoaspartyl peptidase/L-asparaginase-like protein (Ntn-hydrolase superfamily)